MPFTGNYSCDSFLVGLACKRFDFNTGTTDVFKIALYTDAATLNEQTPGYTTTNEVVAAAYTAGGRVLTINQIPVILERKMVLGFADVVWAGSITARGALIYKADGVTNPAICVLDFGATKTQNPFTVNFPPSLAASAIIRLSR